MFVPSASLAEAVICAAVPAPEFSAIVLASVSESLGAPTSNSSKSVTAIVNVVSAVLESVLVALTVIVHDWADS